MPNNANETITKSDTAAACQARRRCSLTDLPEASPRKIGAAPGGSRITKSVTKA